jgi:anti-anti-sigma factor
MNSTANTGRLAIDRDMTIYHAEALKSELMDKLEHHQVIELDLSRIAEIDTAGIQLLMLAKRESMKQDKALRIVAHSPAVSELMDFYNIAGFFGDPLVIPARESN